LQRKNRMGSAPAEQRTCTFGPKQKLSKNRSRHCRRNSKPSQDQRMPRHMKRRVERLRRQRRPLLRERIEQPQPNTAIPPKVFCGALYVLKQQARRFAFQGMRQGGRGAKPLQSVALEIQAGEVWRPRGEPLNDGARIV